MTLRKKLRIPQKENFLNEFEKGQILKKGFGLMETTFFVQTSEMGQLSQKTVLLLKMSSIELNYFFGCFEAFLKKKTCILGPKRDHFRKKLRIPQSEIFSQRV